MRADNLTPTPAPATALNTGAGLAWSPYRELIGGPCGQGIDPCLSASLVNSWLGIMGGIAESQPVSAAVHDDWHDLDVLARDVALHIELQNGKHSGYRYWPVLMSWKTGVVPENIDIQVIYGS